MQEPTHFAMGVALCAWTGRRSVGVVLAFASHLVLDAVPHVDDPNLFAALGPAASRLWHLTEVGIALTVLPLSWWLWRSCQSRGWDGMQFAALMGGGIAASLPDVVVQCGGADSLVGHWNQISHGVWLPALVSLCGAKPSWGIILGGVCVLTEVTTIVFAVKFLAGSGRDVALDRSRPITNTESRDAVLLSVPQASAAWHRAGPKTPRNTTILRGDE